jgi:RNA polymerase sigma-70 factor (sigma-E family)
VDKDGEQEFTTFVRQRTNALVRTAYALCVNQHDAEDLVQNALAKTSLKWSRIHGDPEHYVRRVMYRDFVSAWRWRRTRPEFSVGDVPQRARTGAHDDQTVDRLTIRAALRALPPRQRAVIVLRYLEDMSESDVAEALGCSTGTVASQASRGLARLRESFPGASGGAGRADISTHREVEQA